MKKALGLILSKVLIIAFMAIGFIMARPITACADDLVLESVTIEGRDYLTPGCSAQYKITCIYNNNVEDKGVYYFQSNVTTVKSGLTSGTQVSSDWVDGNKYIRIEFNRISSGSTGTISVDWHGGVRTPESNTVKTVTFSKVPLTITAKDKSYPYNGQTQGPGDTAYDNPADIAEWVSVEGLQSGDRLTGITVDGQGQQAGSYPLRPSNAITEVTNGDTISDDYYDIEYVEGKLTITPETHTVTYKVVNGKWDDDTTGNKSETVADNDHLAHIPSVGNKPSSGFKAGSWSPSAPSTSTAITGNTTYTYTYEQDEPTPPSPTTHTVTYMVVNGKWDDDTTGNKSETVADNDHLAHIPSVGNKPSSGFKAGSWSPSAPNTSTAITGNTTYTYSYVQNDPAPHPRPKDDDDDDHQEDAPAPASQPVNPNAISVMTFVGTQTGNTNIGTQTGNTKIGPQVQGAAAQQAFRMNTPAGWKEAFSFNVTVNDKADYTLKSGILSFRIPSQYLKAGRKYAILGIDKNGNVKLFTNTDRKTDTITVNLNIEGYAFDLIYYD